MLNAESLNAIFRPRSVAVIGASRREGAIGRVIFEKLLESDFNGPVFPVHPTATYVHSVKAYPSIKAVPDPVDLAVIAVKRDLVLNVVKECAEAGVKGLIVITAGFREVGEEGRKLENEILEVVRAHNMRMVGPNCMGVICTDPQVNLNATFAPAVPRRGHIGFVSQSGALGVTILEHAAKLNLGVSMFISIGNKADVAGNDVLDYWRNDPSVEVILMYLESFGRPQQFIRLAQDISRKKPIIIVKSGRTKSGARAASSHTGALAETDVLYDAMFQQCGIIRADTIEEMFDFAMGLANQPLPRGNRVAIITNAGGPGILAADACENLGLQLPRLSDEVQAKIRKQAAAEASLGNPVDLLAAATEEEFRHALSCVLKSDEVDAAIVIFVPPVVTDPIKVAHSVSRAMEGSDKPVMGCFMGVKGVASSIQELQRRGIPAYEFPESAAKTLRAMVDYAQWRSKTISPPVRFQVDRPAAAEIVEKAIAQKRSRLLDHEAFQMLRAYGFPIAETRIGRNWPEIRDAAREIGYPVVLKLSGEDILHKTELQAVRVNIQDEQALQREFDALYRIFENQTGRSDDVRFLVQEMAAGNREVMLGIHHNPKFGPMIAFGLGGVWVEVFRDVIFRFAPLSAEIAEEMVHSIRGAGILKGVRGEPSVDLPLLIESLQRLSQLALDFPQIRELDINPFIVSPAREHCKIVDVRILLQSATDKNV